MNILFFSPSFYQYGNLIEQAFIREGYSVRTVEYCSSIIYKLCSFFKLQRMSDLLKRLFFRGVIKKLDIEKDLYDFVVVIRGSEIPDWFYDKLRNKYVKAIYILYIWDEISLDPRELDVVHYFDKVMSFSKRDCDKYGFTFRPMFYDDSFVFMENKKENDIMLLASYKPSRFVFLKRILKEYPHLKIVALLRCSILIFLRNMDHYSYYTYFNYKGMSYPEMMKTLHVTKACIELPAPGQYAITTRPVEAMSARTKLITSSKSIKDYDFYDEQNILIIDENNPEIDITWLNTKFKDVPDNILKNYSLTNFVKALLS